MNRMKMEIERKFLVIGEAWRKNAIGISCRQGYMPVLGNYSVRIRTAGESAFLTVKEKGSGISRIEYEYPIPLDDAEQMLERLCGQPLIVKTRFLIPHRNLLWEIDEFAGENQGLIVAEVELESEHQKIDRPDWVGQEVTGDARYLNINLGKHPFARWQEKAIDPQ